MVKHKIHLNIQYKKLKDILFDLNRYNRTTINKAVK